MKKDAEIKKLLDGIMGEENVYTDQLLKDYTSLKV